MIESLESSRRVLVCQNRSCRKQGSASVLAAFQSPLVTNITVVGSTCLGECGNGPIVLVMPEQIWYSGVHPSEVPAVVKRHLQDGHPMVSMLYPKYHKPDQQS
ncbi:MAG TPA: (2Fe-2S) ferredoxin domain-containing protein [Coleofasciculaceae cyanobacterium]